MTKIPSRLSESNILQSLQLSPGQLRPWRSDINLTIETPRFDFAF